MHTVARTFLLSAVFLASGMAAQAQLPLPGKTLSKPSSRAGLQQPAKNVKNILAGQVTPECPHAGKTLRELLNYARVNHPALYRQALALRRTGFTQPQVRDWLDNAICSAEGF